LRFWAPAYAGEQGRAAIPKTISTAQEVAYLRALAETGNATVAAERAGVSRDWAYKRRKQDARFDRLCREMGSQARSRLPARVNRDRAGGWTAATEQRFFAALAATADVPVAAASAGSTAATAYRRRMRRPGFASVWHEALEAGREGLEPDWLESAECFFEGRPQPPDNPVKVTSVTDVLRLFARSERADRRRRRE
jgi:hypothetical protein